MTPAEIRASILKLMEAVARIDATLEIALKRQDDTRVAIRDLQAQAAEDRTRIALLERDAESRAKRDAEIRSLRVQVWIAIFTAVATFAGSLVLAYLSTRPRS